MKLFFKASNGIAAFRPAEEAQPAMSTTGNQPRPGPQDPVPVTREEARAREDDFINRLARRIEKAQDVFNPVSKKACSFDPNRRVERWDQKRWAKDAMVRADVFDRSLLAHLPLSPGLRVEAGTSSLFGGFKPQVTVVGLALSPIETYVTEESTARPIGYPALEAALKTVLNPERDFVFVGVFAPTGFDAACLDSVPAGRNYASLLLARGAGTEWKTWGGGLSAWQGASFLFDLETPEERLDRCVATLRGLPALELKGGHVKLDDARRDLGFAADVFDEALRLLTAGSEEYLVREFDGVKILQRSRF